MVMRIVRKRSAQSCSEECLIEDLRHHPYRQHSPPLLRLRNCLRHPIWREACPRFIPPRRNLRTRKCCTSRSGIPGPQRDAAQSRSPSSIVRPAPSAKRNQKTEGTALRATIDYTAPLFCALHQRASVLGAAAVSYPRPRRSRRPCPGPTNSSPFLGRLASTIFAAPCRLGRTHR